MVSDAPHLSSETALRQMYLKYPHSAESGSRISMSGTKNMAVVIMKEERPILSDQYEMDKCAKYLKCTFSN